MTYELQGTAAHTFIRQHLCASANGSDVVPVAGQYGDDPARDERLAAVAGDQRFHSTSHKVRRMPLVSRG
jgi:hypothetical protein